MKNMPNIDKKRENAAVPEDASPRKKRTELRQVMVRISPQLYSALEVIVVGRNIIGSDGRQNSLSDVIRRIVEKHEAEILKEAGQYLRMSVVTSRLKRLPNDLFTRK